MKSNRGDIPITILVIGVFVVCTLALISFFSITIREKNSFVGLNLMQKINSQIETYQVHNVLTGLDIRMNSGGKRVLYQEKKETRGFLWWKKDVVLFSVEYNLE
jgi:hypothetical protein